MSKTDTRASVHVHSQLGDNFWDNSMLNLLQIKDRRVEAYRIGYDVDLKRYTRPAWIPYVNPARSAHLNFRGIFMYPLEHSYEQ